MNRRAFLQIFLLGYPIGLSSLFRFKRKSVKVTYQSIPKAQKWSYKSKSVESFFHQFYGKEGLLFNMKNIQTNKVLGIKYDFSSKDKTVRSEYTYKNWPAFIECERLWQKRYPNHLDPVQHIIVGIA